MAGLKVLLMCYLYDKKHQGVNKHQQVAENRHIALNVKNLCSRKATSFSGHRNWNRIRT